MASESKEHPTLFVGEGTKLRMSAKTLVVLVLSCVALAGAFAKLQWENVTQDSELAALRKVADKAEAAYDKLSDRVRELERNR